MEYWGREILNDFPRVIQEVCDRSGIWTQVFSPGPKPQDHPSSLDGHFEAHPSKVQTHTRTYVKIEKEMLSVEDTQNIYKQKSVKAEGDHESLGVILQDCCAKHCLDLQNDH